MGFDHFARHMTGTVESGGARGRRKLSSSILTSQILVLVVALGLGFGLYVRVLRSDLDHQYEQRALMVAEATANDRAIESDMAAGDPHGTVAPTAERLSRVLGASYIVVIDRRGVRHSHPDPALIGLKVTEPLTALDGHNHVGVDEGNLGPSANGKTPLRAPDGRIIGEVSAGILEGKVSAALGSSLPSILTYSVLALAVGVAASLLLARRLKRQTFGLELHEISSLLQEREAMLHGIREGVVTLDRDGRISLINDEGRRLLGIPGAAVHRRLDEVLAPGRIRDLLSGAAGPIVDETILTADFALVVTRMPVSLRGRPLGAIATARDRTETVGLERELDSVRNLTDALRAQQHEHANRMHVLAGLLELGRVDEASTYLIEVSTSAADVAETLRDRIGSPTVTALLLAKIAIAAERGVSLTVLDDAPAAGADSAGLPDLDGTSVDASTVISVLGNLVDNAIDAAAGSAAPAVTVRLGRLDDGGLTLEIADSGAGVPDPETVFRKGYTTKATRQGFERGLGLTLVRQLVVRHGGDISVTNAEGAVFTVHLPGRAVPAGEPAP